MASEKNTPEKKYSIQNLALCLLVHCYQYQNVFKHALKAKLQDFENSINNKIFICQPASLTTRTELPPKLLCI